MKSKPPHWQAGFTRTELVVVIALIAVLAGITWGAVVKKKAISRQSACAANMKQIATGFSMWAVDNEQNFFSFRVPYSEGGLKGAPDSLPIASAWYQFYFVRSELPSPKVLADPADRNVSVATHWDNGPGGLSNNVFQNNAVSYVLGLDTDVYYPSFYRDHEVLLACRNMTSNRFPARCSSGVETCAGIKMRAVNQLPDIEWGESIHGAGKGNLAKLDGHAERATTETLRRSIALADDSVFFCGMPRKRNVFPEEESGESHWLYPR